MTTEVTTVRADLPAAYADVAARAPRRRFPVGSAAGLVLILTMAAFSVHSLLSLDFSLSNLQTSINTAVRTFSLMGPISVPAPRDLAYLIGLTIGTVVLGTLLASVLSIPVAWISADNTTPAGWLRWVGRAIGVITRAIPDVVLALAFALTFTLGSPLPGIFAMGIHSIGMISKLFADAIEQSDDGPRLAIRAAGGSRAQEFWSGVVPQVLPSWIATMLHRFDINLRGSAILGYAGVGGLGYAMRVAFQQFPTGYGRGLGIAAVIFLLCVVLEFVSSAIRRNLLGIDSVGNALGGRSVRTLKRTRRSAGATPGDAPARSVEQMLKRPWTSDRIRNVGWSLAAVALIVASYWWADVDFSQITWEYVIPTLQSFWPPNFGTHTFGEFAQGMLVTIQVAFAAALLSLVPSLVIGSLAARNVAPTGRVRAVFRFILVFFRGVPELVLAIFLIMITGLGNQAGAIALAFGGIGLLGKLIADSFEEVPRGLERAVTATGATRTQRYFSTTWPVGLPSLIGNSMYLVDTNIRAATLLGIVGGGGVGFYLTQASSVLTFHGQVTTLVAMIVVTVLVVEGIATLLRRIYR